MLKTFRIEYGGDADDLSDFGLIKAATNDELTLLTDKDHKPGDVLHVSWFVFYDAPEHGRPCYILEGGCPDEDGSIAIAELDEFAMASIGRKGDYKNLDCYADIDGFRTHFDVRIKG